MHWINSKWSCGRFAVIILLALSKQNCWADGMRTWKDSSGKHEIQAELVSHTKDAIVLKTAEGKERQVLKSRLSKEDLKYLQTHEATDYHGVNSESEPDPTTEKIVDKDAEMKILKQMTASFFDGLRTSDRKACRDLLTAPARELAEQGKSVLAGLPTPDDGDKSIRIGKVNLDANDATVLVSVKAKGQMNRVSLHFSRNSDRNWQVFAISARQGTNEHVINFEASLPDSTEGNAAPSEDPLLALIGQPVDLTGITLDGKPVSMKDFKGKVVLIDFWATWCGPCRAEIPNIMQNYNEYHDSGFEVIAVSGDKELDQLEEFIAKDPPPWTVVADYHPKNRKSMLQKFGIRAFPSFVLVGRDGKVVDVNCRGPKLGESLARIFASR